jgi:hypothetical protein
VTFAAILAVILTTTWIYEVITYEKIGDGTHVEQHPGSTGECGREHVDGGLQTPLESDLLDGVDREQHHSVTAPGAGVTPGPPISL